MMSCQLFKIIRHFVVLLYCCYGILDRFLSIVVYYVDVCLIASLVLWLLKTTPSENIAWKNPPHCNYDSLLSAFGTAY